MSAPREKEEYDTPAESGHATPYVSSSDSSEVYAPIHAADRVELTRIATNMSNRRQASTHGGDNKLTHQISHVDPEDPRFDPASNEFSLDRWLRMILTDMDQNGVNQKTAEILFENLAVSGSGAALEYQSTVPDIFLGPFNAIKSLFSHESHHKQILHNFSGLVEAGELLVVLGRPGSGCSTLLKSLCGQSHGLTVSDKSTITYNGVPQSKMIKEFQGDVVYNAENDAHFPHLFVGQTLEFAAASRTGAHRLRGMSRKDYARFTSEVVMAIFGLSHTKMTRVGSDFVRGVSGGERKRVSIAEMALAGAPFAAWDNSTRGLDSASAFNFVQSLRTAADLGGSAHAVAIYQASQAIYDTFDKAVVLYQGRQIYFGPACKAKAFFETQGWYCPPRQTTGDFLTSVTNPAERQCREGMESHVPRSPEEFEAYWLKSDEFKTLQAQIERHRKKYPDTAALQDMRKQKGQLQADHVRPKSKYMISIPMQIKLCTRRAYQRVWNDIASTVTTIITQIIMALIIGSIFYGTPDATQGFFAKGAVLFFGVLLNALVAISEINNLYAQRPIVEKHKSYAFYHPSTEAIAGIVSDIPVKFALAVAFNVILYFLSGLRREAAQFFLYFLTAFIITFVMSATFRTLAAITKTISQAMTLAGIFILILIVYTGFVVPPRSMKVWFSWLRWINPIYYSFEILMANEFHGRQFTCSQIIPAYTPLVGDSWICSVVGAVAGQRTVSGDDFIRTSYDYSYSHVWRNFGILIAFLFAFMGIYFVATELNSSTSSTAEVLVFRKGHAPAAMVKNESSDEETTNFQDDKKESGNRDDVAAIPPQKDIFTWKDVVYDIPYGKGRRVLLDHVSGYVKPGTLTALMGSSGAGKTTLLDVLASRVTMGIITGDMLVNGAPRDSSFQRKTGYVQQQDLHLQTATVRESLRFSAMLRQPKSVSKQEKYDYVEEVIKMLNMEDFAEAVVGVPGMGLNVEQRKLLTIGVELAAKPKLLLFLDEPTSGLDSQSAWAICAFLKKLAAAGQAVLCTIHQPSAILFQEFDRLLFLAKGGKTVYFGPIGENSRTLLDYFESHGSRKCGDEENPAEFMLEVVNQKVDDPAKDWHSIWEGSEENKTVAREIEDLHQEGRGRETDAGKEDPREHEEFAMPLTAQIAAVTHRVFQQYWRTPEYIMAKWVLGVAAGLFIGFSFFNSGTSQQGLQNVIFSIFMICTIFNTVVQQIMPLFVVNRSLYEVRERPSKAYSWKAFLIGQIVVEVPYNIVLALLVFACYYYAVQGVQSSFQQGVVLLFLLQFFIYTSTFAHLCIAALPDETTASAVVTLLFALSLTFNGVMQTPSALPGFWVFMYRVSPFTYWVSGIVSTQLEGKPVDCSTNEVSRFPPPAGQTCAEYLAPYLRLAPGKLLNPESTTECNYCQLSTAEQFLAGSNIYPSQKWRQWGIFWVYVIFNIFGVILLYWAFRVKKFSPAAGFARVGKLKGLVAKKPKPLADDQKGKEFESAPQPV